MTFRATVLASSLMLASPLPLAACTRPGGPCPPCAPGPATFSLAPAAALAAADAADLERALDAVHSADAADARAAVYAAERATTLLERRWADGRLRPALDVLAARFRATHPAAAHRVDEAGRVAAFVGAQLWLRGRHPSLASAPAPTWAALADAHAAFLASSAVPRATRSLDDAAYLAELETAGGAPFTEGNDVEVLVDGPASWAVREPLLAGATGDVWIASWALYDDRTGREAVDTLLARAAAGARITFVVDGQTASLPPYDDEVARLETEARRRSLPVTVTRWHDPARPYDGMHWKLLLVGDACLTGGMNFGDAYSHKGRTPGRGWRDTDVVVRGPAVADARRRFAARFGAEASGAGDAPPSADARPAGERVAVVVHAPGDDDPVLRSLLKAIDGATRTIDLEHAYVVRIPSVEAALVAAVRRGVRVRLLTNSLESCDEPVVAQAILRSVGPLADAGVEVWLRRGSTLHSKFAAIDGVFAQVGSYNLHPRSLRLEHELAVNVLGPRTAARLHAVFEADLAAATRVRSSADLPPSEDPLARLAWWLCRDLL
jgi:cardiolipin synthase